MLLLVVGVVGCWLLVAGCWLLVVACWLLLDAVAAEVVVTDCLLQQVDVVYFVAVEELSDHSAD